LTLLNNISVIIPVFNAAPYVTVAVESALRQQEVAEVLLIEDRSTDDSLEVCKQLTGRHNKVRLLVHPNNENRGAGESRNLGIKNAKSDFIAFLDADDYFLPDRFRAERKIFSQNVDVDGVYGALGFHYYSNTGKIKYEENGYTEEISTFSNSVPANELVFAIMHLHNRAKGQLTIDTLTLKKNVFNGKTDFFNSLKLHEDTAFFIQLSINCVLASGEIEQPIGMRGVHDNNRIVNIPHNSKNRLLYWKYLYDWSLTSVNGKKFSKLFGANWMKEKLLLSNNKYTGSIQLLWYCMTNSLFLRKDILFAPAAKHVLGKRTGPYILNYKQRIQMNIFKDHPYSSIMDEFIKKRGK
jgi:glycosyltransferase involved in cell wall biosynthesis